MLTDLEVQLEQLRPDLLCGEITPEHLRTPWEGYYPPEVALVELLAGRLGVAFAAADWRGDFKKARAAEASMSLKANKRYADAHLPLIARWNDRRGALFDLLHGAEAQSLIRAAHELRLSAGGEAADGFEPTRNLRIVERCMQAASERRSRRAVFVFGAEHKYAIEDKLLRQHGLRAREVRRLFVPAMEEQPEAAVERGRERRADLCKLAETSTDTESVQKKILESRQLLELERFIESKARAGVSAVTAPSPGAEQDVNAGARCVER